LSILKAAPSWTPSLDLGALKNATDADPAAFLRPLGSAGIGALKHPSGTTAAHGRLLLGSGSSPRSGVRMRRHVAVTLCAPHCRGPRDRPKEPGVDSTEGGR
jgi:hypothetical protein